jgi:hypothetical protein
MMLRCCMLSSAESTEPLTIICKSLHGFQLTMCAAYCIFRNLETRVMLIVVEPLKEGNKTQTREGSLGHAPAGHSQERTRLVPAKCLSCDRHV